ncbi:MAG TPA: hypothetical protein VLA82_10920 [Actinomycetota bacterium]|nr:hypothetical protein [Actinomycetota bacterium]
MKLRSLFLLAVGFVAGVAFARRMNADDPNVIHGPVAERAPANPAVRLATTQAQRLADRASDASLAAIRRTRSAIQGRLEAYDDDDDVAWG